MSKIYSQFILTTQLLQLVRLLSSFFVFLYKPKTNRIRCLFLFVHLLFFVLFIRNMFSQLNEAN